MPSYTNKAINTNEMQKWRNAINSDSISQVTNLINQKANQSDLNTTNDNVNDLTSNLADIVINAKSQYGADPTGVKDSTVAIQQALDYVGQNGGGVVYLPKGVYKIQPQTEGEDAALYIRYNNIILNGQGRNQTQLSFYTYNGVNPSTNFYLVNSKVWRGHGIEITGGADSSTIRKNIIIKDLELNGNNPYTGNQVYPANTTTGDGWDITNKGICIQADKYHDNIKFINCHIHDFKGELIYGGGVNIGKVYLYDSVLHSTNGDCWSVTGQATVKRNELYNAAHAGIEDSYRNVPCLYADNYIHDNDHDGISLLLNGSEPYGHVRVEDNLFVNNPRNGILLQGVHNITVRRNIIIDCGQNLASQSDNGAYGGIYLQSLSGYIFQNVEIYDNKVFAETKIVQKGIYVPSSVATSAKGLYIHNNYCGLTDLGVSNGVSMSNGFSYDSYPTANNCKFWNNINDGTTYLYTNKSNASEVLITSTSLTTIAQQRPQTTPSNKLILIYYRVVNASTPVTITVGWYDASGTKQTQTLVNNVTQPVGSYTLAPLFINAQGASESQYIQVNALTGTANNVYVSASIQDIK